MSTDKIAADGIMYIFIRVCVCVCVVRMIKISEKYIRCVYMYETSFSRLSTQGPQTPGKLHEPS